MSILFYLLSIQIFAGLLCIHALFISRRWDE
jgi:nitrogen fixation-related uncharacterized protein